MQIISLVWGVIAMLGTVIFFLPCLGSLNWLNIPFAVIGFIVSLMAHNKDSFDSKTGSLVGMVLCALAVLIGFFRLKLGAGIL